MSIQMRKDALPEGNVYADEGCVLYPSCLACPLPECRYDVLGGVKTIRNRKRDDAIRQLRQEDGVPIDALARDFRVCRRTIFRVLRGAA